MFDCMLERTPQATGAGLRQTLADWHACSRATLAGATALMLLSLVAPTIAQAQPAPTQRPNIVVIMGDDIGIWNIGAYHRGMMAAVRPISTSLPPRACCSLIIMPE